MARCQHAFAVNWLRLGGGIDRRVFVNLFALFRVGATPVSKDTGVKLHHVDRQLATRDTVLNDLTQRLEE